MQYIYQCDGIRLDKASPFDHTTNPSLLSLLSSFCDDTSDELLSHHSIVGELFLMEYENEKDGVASSLNSVSGKEVCRRAADVCVRGLFSGDSMFRAESIVYIQILAVLVADIEVRYGFTNPSPDDLVGGLILLSTHRSDPTLFLFESFELLLILLSSHHHAKTEGMTWLQERQAGCEHCCWGPDHECSLDLLARHMEPLGGALHLVLLNCTTGELLACAWFLIGSILRSPVAETFLLHWDDVGCIEAACVMDSYELLRSAEFRDASGLWWLLITVEVLLALRSADVHRESTGIVRGRSFMILSILVKFWIEMNISARVRVKLTEIGAVVAHDGQPPSYVHSFRMEESFQALRILRVSFLEAADCLMVSTDCGNFLKILDQLPYTLHQPQHYMIIVQNLPGITLTCFETLEDAILVREECSIAICAELCGSLLRALDSLLEKSCSSPPCEAGNGAAGNSVRDAVSMLYDSHYVVSVYEHLTSNLSNWSALRAGHTSIDLSVLAELVGLLKNGFSLHGNYSSTTNKKGTTVALP